MNLADCLGTGRLSAVSPFAVVALVALGTVAPTLLVGCHGAGPYGHSVAYAPSVDEAKAVTGAREYDPVMFQRLPDEWRGKPVTLFGVVTRRDSGPGGGAALTLSVRRLEPRNLCDNMNDEDSCRVTVSDTDFGVMHVIVPLRAEDDTGEHSASAGSLFRVVGTLGEDVDTNDGTPILRATFYRHWPRNFYVTKAASRNMRQ